MHISKTILSVAVAISVLPSAVAVDTQRWNIGCDGSITWHIDDRVPHYDHIEMSGEQVSVVLRYGVNADGSFSMERSVVWPMLRTVPNNTHASLTRRTSVDPVSMLMVDGLTLNDEKVESMTLDGKLTVVSRFNIGHTRGVKRPDKPLQPGMEVTRVYFPSTTLPVVCEHYTVKNISDKTVDVTLPYVDVTYTTAAEKGVDGAYTVRVATDCGYREPVTLAPGEYVSFGAAVSGVRTGEPQPKADIARELAARDEFVARIWRSLRFESPDTVLNTAFAFAKIRASESIYRTRGGLMHGPGGEAYYAAIWANDQAEYVNPFFPYLGYDTANESAMNSFRHFARFMNPDYRTIPSSIIAEGTDVWNGAGDRGDCAMIAYGAARLALQLGDRDKAGELWPLITWCLEYCRRNINAAGVVASDSDELEGRFPAGKANLCTSTLYYDALISAGYLADELGYRADGRRYRKAAAVMRGNIGRYFAANVEGYDTYRYYDGNDVLRSWICMPLVTGIFDRKEGTVSALLSPLLLTEDGLLTQSGTSVYWDRSTLYAMRGIYAAGEHRRATEFLRHYSANRLLGEHVPYAIEAWPEGNQRHLSAESGLYCRVITEGMFGFRPTGFRSFELTPQLPDGWDSMSLCDVGAFGGGAFDVGVTRKGTDRINVTVTCAGKTVYDRTFKAGGTVKVKLPE